MCDTSLLLCVEHEVQILLDDLSFFFIARAAGSIRRTGGLNNGCKTICIQLDPWTGNFGPGGDAAD
jgi:hypothetical protein